MAYIKFEDLQKFPIRLDHYDKENGNEHFILGIETVIEYAENLPTADVVEVKHGCWQIEDRGGKTTDKPICSQCGATPKYYVNGESSPYCQECGSKMERKVKPYAG